MKKRIAVIVLLVCCFQAGAVSAWQGYVVKVLDGDSIRVKKQSETVEIRLYGIDCPEWKQSYGNRAKRFTKAHLYHKYVEVEPRDIDRYGRVVSLVTTSGKLINRELVKNGLAWVYGRYCLDESLCSELFKLEEAARNRGIGLWRDANALSPWNWKRHRASSHSRKSYRKYRYPLHND